VRREEWNRVYVRKMRANMRVGNRHDQPFESLAVWDPSIRIPRKIMGEQMEQFFLRRRCDTSRRLRAAEGEGLTLSSIKAARDRVFHGQTGREREL